MFRWCSGIGTVLLTEVSRHDVIKPFFSSGDETTQLASSSSSTQLFRLRPSASPANQTVPLLRKPARKRQSGGIGTGRTIQRQNAGDEQSGRVGGRMTTRVQREPRRQAWYVIFTSPFLLWPRPENSTASLWDLTFSCCQRVGTSGRKISGS